MNYGDFKDRLEAIEDRAIVALNTAIDLKEHHSSLEKRVDEHLHEGIGVWKALEGVKTDLQWVKRAIWTLVSVVVSLVAILTKMVIFHG